MRMDKMKWMQSRATSSTTTAARKITKTVVPSDSAFIMRIKGFVMAGPFAGSP
jgi:hypothetical protein